MPNWCCTAYTMVGEEDDVRKAKDALESVFNTKREYSGDATSFKNDSNWLGYIASDILGIDVEKTSIGCRGLFTSPGIEEFRDGLYAVTFSTETAWTDCDELMNRLAAKFNLSNNYLATEPGCDYYVKHSPDGVYTCNYIRYSFTSGEEEYDTIEQLVAAMQNVGYKVDKDTTFETLCELVEKDGDSINVYEIV